MPDKQPGIRDVTIHRPGGTAPVPDRVAVEEPLEVRVNGAPFAVIMRTPGADRELAAGFLLAEDVIRSSDEIGAIEHCVDTAGEGCDNLINVIVRGDAVARLARMGIPVATSWNGRGVLPEDHPDIGKI